MRFNKLTDSLLERLDRALFAIYRDKDPCPECPVCRVAGKHGKMVRDTRRGVICDECGSRIW
jgi:hypothetical protein